jgi:hypothetical protein
LGSLVICSSSGTSGSQLSARADAKAPNATRLKKTSATRILTGVSRRVVVMFMRVPASVRLEDPAEKYHRWVRARQFMSAFEHHGVFWVSRRVSGHRSVRALHFAAAFPRPSMRECRRSS